MKISVCKSTHKRKKNHSPDKNTDQGTHHNLSNVPAQQTQFTLIADDQRRISIHGLGSVLNRGRAKQIDRIAGRTEHDTDRSIALHGLAAPMGSPMAKWMRSR